MVVQWWSNGGPVVVRWWSGGGPVVVWSNGGILHIYDAADEVASVGLGGRRRSNKQMTRNYVNESS